MDQVDEMNNELINDGVATNVLALNEPIFANRNQNEDKYPLFVNKVNYYDCVPGRIIVPIDQISTLLKKRFSSEDQELGFDDDIVLDLNYSIHPVSKLININSIIANLIIGRELSNLMMSFTLTYIQMYLDGKAEILPNGDFRILSKNENRDGRNRRFSALCLYLMTALQQRGRINNLSRNLTLKYQQILIKKLYGIKNTSMRVSFNPIMHNSLPYQISTSDLTSWILTTPWAHVLFNRNSSLSTVDLLRLIFELHVLFTGATIYEHNPNTSNTLKPTTTIFPNSELFNSLAEDDENIYRNVNNIDNEFEFLNFILSMYYGENNDS